MSNNSVQFIIWWTYIIKVKIIINGIDMAQNFDVFNKEGTYAVVTGQEWYGITKYTVK